MRAGCALGIGLAWTAMILVMSYLFEKLFLRLLDMAEERLKKCIGKQVLFVTHEEEKEAMERYA